MSNTKLSEKELQKKFSKKLDHYAIRPLIITVVIVLFFSIYIALFTSMASIYKLFISGSFLILVGCILVVIIRNQKKQREQAMKEYERYQLDKIIKNR